MFELNPETALGLVRATAGLAILISTAERIATPALHAADGLLSWRTLGTRPLWTVPGPHHLLEPLFQQRGLTAVLWLRTLLAAVIMIPGCQAWVYAAALAGVVAATAVVNYLCLLGGNGSDQMTTLLAVSLLLAYAFPANGAAREAVLLFIAAQACLSYFTAGIAKLLGPVWRSGDAVSRVFATRSYGLPQVNGFLQRRPWMGKILTWNVLAAEIAFPLVLVLPPSWAAVFLAWGVLFHVMNAFIMGLNVFFWAFVATYPAIIFANGLVRGVLFG